jgi:hypothetical protein
MLDRCWRRGCEGGIAGAVATVAMTLEQPLDKRLFDSEYDDVEILGKLVTRGDDWRPIGFALHVLVDHQYLAHRPAPSLSARGSSSLTQPPEQDDRPPDVERLSGPTSAAISR